MKKSFVLIIFIFILDLFLAKVSFAAPVPPPSPSISTETASISATNPAPPIGMPCGNTVCLPSEECIQYPGDKYQHCVPLVLTSTTPTPTPSITLSPSVSVAPTPPIIPTPAIPPKCSEGTGVYPPNSTCYSDVKSTQADPKNYEKTCIYQPVVKYKDTRKYNTGKQPFIQCGKGDGGPYGAGPGGNDPDCDVALLINTDVKEAELGGYGPSTPAEEVYGPDFLAQNYLYNSLFDRPLDLSDKNREAYRTYWRLLPASNQANLRSFILNMANDNQIDNIKFDFTDTNGLKKSTDFKKLYDALSKQVILFWRFPFIRVGCLTSYPVCPEYAQATRELKPVFQDLLDTALRLDLPIATPAIQAYNTVIAAFGGDLDGPYNAFVPLDFNSVRSYILKKKDEKEDAAYKFFNEFKPLPFYHLTNVSFEHLPYVGAVYQGLLSPKFGMLPALQPQWLIDRYASEGGIISDYKIGNTPETTPEVSMAHQGFLEQLEAEAKALIASPWGWISDKIVGLFSGDKGLKKGYITADKDKYTDNDRIAVIREVYSNPVMCPLPISYHEYTPKTIPKSIDDHRQVVIIPGQRLAWSYTPACSKLGEKCTTVGTKVVCVPAACTGKGAYVEGDQCCEPAWSVEATEDAKALDVLNNPKQSDIRDAVNGKSEYSFYEMLIPSGKTKVPEALIDAPIAKHILQKVVPNGGGEVLNPAESIMRVSNLAQDSMHFLQNCWTVPKNLQNSPRCNLVFVTPEEATSSSCPVVDDSQVDSKLLGGFKSNFIDLANRWSAKCPGAEHNKAEECYNFVASTAKKGGVNPAFALTIWLNESGASNYCNGGPTSQDMGINLSSMYMNLEEQIKVFINMAKQKLCDGLPGYMEPMHGWLSRFQSHKGVCDITDATATKYYLDVMNFTWAVVTGCNKNGKFGITWPTDMSCP